MIKIDKCLLSSIFSAICVLLVTTSSIVLVTNNYSCYGSIEQVKTENIALQQDIDSLRVELDRYQKATMLYMKRAASYRGNSDDN